MSFSSRFLEALEELNVMTFAALKMNVELDLVVKADRLEGPEDIGFLPKRSGCFGIGIFLHQGLGVWGCLVRF